MSQVSPFIVTSNCGTVYAVGEAKTSDVFATSHSSTNLIGDGLLSLNCDREITLHNAYSSKFDLQPVDDIERLAYLALISDMQDWLTRVPVDALSDTQRMRLQEVQAQAEKLLNPPG